MGKNKNKKTKTVNSSSSEKKKPKGLCCKKRNELNEILKKIMRLTSEIIPDGKVNWEAHLEIDKLLQKVQEIEPLLNTDRNREEHFPNLLTWIKENGGVTENVLINKFDKMEYGLEAAKDLEEGELICAVPRNLMMTLENVENSPLKHLFNTNPILKNMGNITLALFLIIEYLKGENSFWYSYISSLPTKYNTVLYFSADELLELKCSPTFEPAVKHCKRIACQYAYFSHLFQSSDDEASLILRDTFTYQLYRWAVSTVMTRQNFIPSKEGEIGINSLIPFWDMCNHTNGYLSTQYNADRSECLACKAFKKGEQVLIYYGQRSSSDFFVHNGFVYEENENDTFRLRLGISKSDKLHDLRCELLKGLGLPESGDFYLHSGPKPVREELLAFLRIFNMDADCLNRWKISSRLNDLMYHGVDRKVESKVWNFLFNRINLLLVNYSESVEINDPTLSDCRRLVRMQLSLEKKFLTSVLEYVQQQIKILEVSFFLESVRLKIEN